MQSLKAHLSETILKVRNAETPSPHTTGMRYADAMRIIAATLRSTSASVVDQQETLIRMAVRPCQTVTPHQ